MNKKIFIAIFIAVVAILALWFFQSHKSVEPASVASPELASQTLSSWVNKSGVIDSFSNSTLVIKTADGTSFSCLVSGTTKISRAGMDESVAKGDVVFARLDTNTMSVSRGASLSDVSAGPGIFVGTAVSVKPDSVLLRDVSGIEKNVAITSTTTIVVQKKGAAEELKPGLPVNVSCHNDGASYTAGTVSIVSQ